MLVVSFVKDSYCKHSIIGLMLKSAAVFSYLLEVMLECMHCMHFTFACASIAVVWIPNHMLRSSNHWVHPLVMLHILFGVQYNLVGTSDIDLSGCTMMHLTMTSDIVWSDMFGVPLSSGACTKIGSVVWSVPIEMCVFSGVMLLVAVVVSVVLLGTQDVM